MAAVRWTVSRAMKSWGVARTTVLRWIAEGRVPAEQRETPRGPVWFILDGDRPQPSLAPIEFRGRASRQPAEPASEPEVLRETSDDTDFTDMDFDDEEDDGA
jgi:hypothetical protein